MTRFLFAFMGTAVLILILLAVFFLKDAYKILPIQGSDPDLISEYASWQEFKSPKGSFQVKFPTPPQSAEQTVQDPKKQTTRHYEMYVAEKLDGSVFMVSIIDFQNNQEPMRVLEKTIINDLVISNPQNQLQSMDAGVYGLFKTINFVIKNPSSSIHGRTFSDGNAIYLQTVIFKTPEFDSGEYDYFIQSFEWIAPQ